MTVRRDFNAGSVRFLLQADGPSGALVDRSRSAVVVTPNNYATNAADQLFGVNSFTGNPTFPGIQFSNRFTLEGFAKFVPSPSGVTQTFISSLNPQSNRPVEFGFNLTAGSQRKFEMYSGNRGYSSTYPQPTMPVDLPPGWAHFFIASDGGNTWWCGVNGVMSPYVQAGFTSDHLGNALNAIMLNNIAQPPGNVDQSNLGKLHSIMLTDGMTRYPYSPSGAYTKPDDLLTNWYRDAGASNDPDTTPICLAMPVVNAGAKYRNTLGTKIAGHVTYSGVNSSRRVGLYTRGGILLDTTYSRADGYFEFVSLDTNVQFFVAAFDDLPGALNAEIADHLVPA